MRASHPSQGTVKKAGREVVLTGREYSLLEFLALNRGKLVTRTMLYEHLFDENDDSISKVVEVHVWWLTPTRTPRPSCAAGSKRCRRRSS